MRSLTRACRKTSVPLSAAFVFAHVQCLWREGIDPNTFSPVRLWWPRVNPSDATPSRNAWRGVLIFRGFVFTTRCAFHIPRHATGLKLYMQSNYDKSIVTSPLHGDSQAPLPNLVLLGMCLAPPVTICMASAFLQHSSQIHDRFPSR